MVMCIDRYIRILLTDRMQVLNEEINKNLSSRPANYAEAFHRRMKSDLFQA